MLLFLIKRLFREAYVNVQKLKNKLVVVSDNTTVASANFKKSFAN